MRRAQILMVALCAVGLAYWATLPPHDLALDSACRLTDMQARLSAAIHGQAFWRAQEDAVTHELADVQTLTATVDRQDEAARSAMSPIESHMSRLSGSSDGTADDQATARAREQRERFAQMGHLAVCRAVIAKHRAENQ